MVDGINFSLGFDPESIARGNAMYNTARLELSKDIDAGRYGDIVEKVTEIVGNHEPEIRKLKESIQEAEKKDKNSPELPKLRKLLDNAQRRMEKEVRPYLVEKGRIGNRLVSLLDNIGDLGVRDVDSEQKTLIRSMQELDGMVTQVGINPHRRKRELTSWFRFWEFQVPVLSAVSKLVVGR